MTSAELRLAVLQGVPVDALHVWMWGAALFHMSHSDLASDGSQGSQRHYSGPDLSPSVARSSGPSGRPVSPSNHEAARLAVRREGLMSCKWRYVSAAR